MKCKKCGETNQKNAKYCQVCGEAFGENKNQKNMLLAFIISFFLMGMGIAYAGKTKKAMIIFLSGLIFVILSKQISILGIIAVIIWIYGLYETYNQIRIANGCKNPNILEDWKKYSTSKKVLSVLIVILIFFIVASTVTLSFISLDVCDFSEDYTHEIPLNEDTNDTVDKNDILPVDEVDSQHPYADDENYSQLEFDDNQLNSYLNGYDELPDNIKTDGKTYVYVN